MAIAKIRKDQFKLNVSVTGSEPIATLVSIYDLLYNEEGVLRSQLHKGIKLSHDLIIYNPTLYTSNNQIMPQISEEAYFKFSIEIQPVSWDPRSKPIFVPLNISAANTFLPTHNGSFGYWMWDKKAALYPTLRAYHTQDSTTLMQPLNTSSDFTSFLSCIPSYSVGVADTDIVLTSPDETVLNTFQTSFNLYNEIYCTLQAPIAKAFAHCIQYHNNNQANEYIKSGLYDAAIVDFFKDNNIKNELKNMYVWVVCSFFGDYIMQEDYNQELNQKASVQHTNLYLGNKDQLKYDSDDTIQDSENTIEYLPKTAPLVDLLSSNLYSDYKAYNDNELLELENSLENYIKEKGFNDLGFKGLLPATVRTLSTNLNSFYGEGTETSFVNHLSIPGWYDPENKLEKVEDNFGKTKPVLAPVDGNISINGRIYSTTTDEIWVALKTLFYGRQNDNETNKVVNITSSAFNTTDRDHFVPKARKDRLFTEQDGGNIRTFYGDVLDYDFIEKTYNTTTYKTLKILDYITSPEVVTYTTYNFVSNLSNVVVGDLEEFNIFKYKVPVVENTQHFNVTENFIEETNENQQQITKDSNNFWSLRENPYSLVELEFLIKELKYNFYKSFGFITNTYSIIGNLGRKQNVDDVQNKLNGSLYQLHKDYDVSTINAPNTLVDTTTKAYQNFEAPNQVVRMDVEGNYGSSEELKTSSKDFSSSEIYLAADGTWRSVREHNRCFVLDEIEEPF